MHQYQAKSIFKKRGTGKVKFQNESSAAVAKRVILNTSSKVSIAFRVKRLIDNEP